MQHLESPFEDDARAFTEHMRKGQVAQAEQVLASGTLGEAGQLLAWAIRNPQAAQPAAR